MPESQKTKRLPSRIVKRAPRKRRSKLFPESQVQIALLQWLRAYNFEVWQSVIKIDNEGKRTPQGHILAVAMGLHVGASDLFIAWPTRRFAGLFVEIKPPGYKVTKSKLEHYHRQMNFIHKMLTRGYQAQMGIGIDQCITIVKDYLSQP